MHDHWLLYGPDTGRRIFHLHPLATEAYMSGIYPQNRENAAKTIHTTSAFAPGMPSPFVFFIVAEKNKRSPVVLSFAMEEPDGSLGASVV